MRAGDPVRACAVVELRRVDDASSGERRVPLLDMCIGVEVDTCEEFGGGGVLDEDVPIFFCLWDQWNGCRCSQPCVFTPSLVHLRLTTYAASKRVMFVLAWTAARLIGRLIFALSCVLRVEMPASCMGQAHTSMRIGDSKHNTTNVESMLSAGEDYGKLRRETSCAPGTQNTGTYFL